MPDSIEFSGEIGLGKEARLADYIKQKCCVKGQDVDREIAGGPGDRSWIAG